MFSKKQLFVLLAACLYCFYSKSMEGDHLKITHFKVASINNPSLNSIAATKQADLVMKFAKEDDLKSFKEACPTFQHCRFFDEKYQYGSPFTVAAEHGNIATVTYILKLLNQALKQEEKVEVDKNKSLKHYPSEVVAYSCKPKKSDNDLTIIVHWHGTLHRLAASHIISEELACEVAKIVVTFGANITALASPVPPPNLNQQIEFDPITIKKHVATLIAYYRGWQNLAQYLDEQIRSSTENLSHFSDTGPVSPLLAKYLNYFSQIVRKTNFEFKNPKTLDASQRTIADLVHELVTNFGGEILPGIIPFSDTEGKIFLWHGGSLCKDRLFIPYFTAIALAYQRFYPLEAREKDEIFKKECDDKYAQFKYLRKRTPDKIIELLRELEIEGLSFKEQCKKDYAKFKYTELEKETPDKITKLVRKLEIEDLVYNIEIEEKKNEKILEKKSLESDNQVKKKNQKQTKKRQGQKKNRGKPRRNRK